LFYQVPDIADNIDSVELVVAFVESELELEKESVEQAEQFVEFVAYMDLDSCTVVDHADLSIA